MKQTLVEIFSEIGHFGSDVGCNDKGSSHTYLEIYDKLFEPFRNGCSIMEIGLAVGDSMKLWDRYFENSKIFGIDITVVFKAPLNGYNNDVKLIEVDATKPELLERIGSETFDIVIDDGDHQEKSQVATFNLLKLRMKKGGVYIIEDIIGIDYSRERFIALHENCEVIDMRSVNGNFANVLIVYKF